MKGALLDRFEDDLKEAMKAGERDRVSVIRLLRAALHNRAIEKGRERTLTDQEVLEVLQAAIRQRRDSIEQFARGQRQDLVSQEERELTILRAYLPPPLSRAELEAEVQRAVAEVSASGPREMGKVMAVLMPRVVGRAEGAEVSLVVRDVLGRPGREALAGG